MLAALLLGTTIIFNSCKKEEEEELPTVVTGEITDVAFQSAYCEGNVTDDGGSTITKKGVCWCMSGTPTLSDAKTDNGSGVGSYKSALNGLSPNTTYIVRAYATSSAGTAYGTEKTFKTKN